MVNNRQFTIILNLNAISDGGVCVQGSETDVWAISPEEDFILEGKEHVSRSQ